MNKQELRILPGKFSVAQLATYLPLPFDWDHNEPFFCVVRTPEEISVVCAEDSVPEGVRSESGWKVMKIVGPLDFSQVGILAGIATILAQVEVSIFTISTYNTDYILVKADSLEVAIQALSKAGYSIVNGV